MALHAWTLTLLALLATASAPGRGDAALHAHQEDAPLAIQPAEIEARVGMALWIAGRGDAEGAVESLDALPGGELDEALTAEIARERERLTLWIELRDAFVEELIANGTKVSVPHGEKRMSVKFLKRDGDELTLAPNKQKRETLRVSEIPPIDLAKLMGKGAERFQKTWVRSYAYALAGDKRWKKLLRDKSDAALAFKQDAETRYPKRLSIGEAAAALHALSEMDPPHDATSAQATLASVEDLRSRFGSAPLVVSRTGALRGLTEAALEEAFTRDDLPSVFRGKCELLDEGRVRLRYDFEKEDQLLDFVEDRDYLPAVRGRSKPVAKETETLREWKEGQVFLEGSTCFRNRLWIASPMTLRYKVEFQKARTENVDAMRLLVGFSDNADESYAGCLNFGDLEVRDMETGYGQHAYSRRGTNFKLYKPYEMEVRQNEEARIFSTVDGKPKNELDGGERTAGWFFLWVHADLRVVFHELEIEGKLGDESFEAAKEAWVEQQLAARGF